MDYQGILDKYYPKDNALRHVLLSHSRSVTEFALRIVVAHPELGADAGFVREGAMLHDLGVFRCDAPSIFCTGKEPYIRHGLLGAEILREEGFPRHARVCERHTGTGITVQDIRVQHLPLPERDFLPETIEEQIICFADKFFSKTHLEVCRTPVQARAKLVRFGEDGVSRFDHWASLFL